MSDYIKILLIENSRDKIKFVKQLAEEQNSKMIKISVSGELSDIEKRINEITPDILLLNTDLADDGTHASAGYIDRIKQILPVIVVTDRIDDENAARCFDAGAEDLLSYHELTPAMFHHSVDLVLRKKQSSRNKEWNELTAAFVKDMTERNKIEDALIKARDNAEKSDRLKTEFLAQMSHEIRTPVNIILSYTRLIESELKDHLPEDLKNSFSAIDKAGIRIIRTIDLLLNFSEVTTGNYEKQIRPVDVYLDILLKLFIENKRIAVARNIEMTIDKQTDDTVINADEHSATQIFVNLIENAVKYTNQGTIRILIRRNEFNELVVEIEDTGIGISEEYLPNLFQPFSQEDKGYTRIFEGNGLGLALVKKYCEVNNADIRVKSRKGHGSTFTITFPA